METIVLNIIPSGILPVCHVSQNDNERLIRIKLYEGFEIYHIKSGDEITIHLRKPNGDVISSELEYNVGDDFIDLEVADNMCDIDGRNLCELRIINGSIGLGTSNFYMFVELDPGYTPTPPVPPQMYGLQAIDLSFTIAD